MLGAFLERLEALARVASSPFAGRAFGLFEVGRLYRAKETIALPICQRCGRKVRRPLVVLKDDETGREVYLGPTCAAKVLRTQEDVPERAPDVVDEEPVDGERPSCCDVEYDDWKTDHPISYREARDILHGRQRRDAAVGRYWNVTHAMTLREIGRNRKKRWRQCRSSCGRVLYRGDLDRPGVYLTERGGGVISVDTSPRMELRREGSAWLLLDDAGEVIERHTSRDDALQAAQAAADLPF